MKKAVLLLGHGDPESFNAKLAETYQTSFVESGGEIELFRLADLKFDPILRYGFQKPQPLEPDLQRLQQAIEKSDHLVWVFPTYWGSPPAVVRGLVDRLFLPGWAFKFEKESALPEGLLSGRSARVILTMDSPFLWYTLVNHRTVHRSFGGATLKFCGLKPMRFTTLYSARTFTEEKRDKWRSRIAKLAAHEASRLAGQ
jgi:NAD(P)H dehydrogenase (quinone)